VRRGRLIEVAMAALFKAVGISIREPFTVVAPDSGGIVEQVDGMIELDGRLFFVEIKWLQGNLDKGDASMHLVRVYHRPEVHGLFVSATPFTQGALTVCTEALQKERLIVLCTLQEFFQVLEARTDLLAFLRAKIHAVIAQKTPFPEIPRGHRLHTL
jgi:restriction system protein